HLRLVARGLGQVLPEFADHVAQPVNLLLPLKMAFRAARILDVALAAHHLPDRLRLRAIPGPQLHCENHRTAAWPVIEHRLERRIRIDTAIPVRLAVDPYRGKT